MLIQGRSRRTIWTAPDGAVEIIDQTLLPHAVMIRRLDTVAQAVTAIAHMQVRGAPLIGVTAAWGLALALMPMRRTTASPPRAPACSRPVRRR